MTTAGITTLYIAREALAREGRDKGSQREAAGAIQRGLAWLDARFSTTGNPSGAAGVLRDRYPAYGQDYFHHYYFLYGIERVASLLDRDTFGGLPWYRQGAHEVLARESPEGGWGSGEGTCFAILFLRRATLSGTSHRSVVADDADLTGDGGAASADSETARAAFRDSWGVPLIAAASAGDESLAHWAYTTDEPPRSWNKRAFDDDDWARGLAGFGTAGATGLTVRTLWQGPPDLWVRRSFHWKPGDDELGLHVIHDDAVEVFINGKLAAEGALWSQGRYVSYGLSNEARKALRSGENVVAAHVHDIGGGRSLDVRFTRPEDVSRYSDHWLHSRPWADVAFVRRWQIAGPVNNPEHLALLDRESPERVNDKGERSVAGESWREHRVLADQLNLGDVLSARENTLCWAATGLSVDEREKCYLWLAASGGLRAWLDGVPLMLNHEHVEARASELRVPVTLTAGFHRLVFAVEQRGEPAVLRARLARVTGAPVESLRYGLEVPQPDGAEAARAATAQPGQFSLRELAEVLPESSSRALEFGRVEHLQSIGVWSTGPETPRWIDRPQAKDPGPSPPSGARGMLLLRPRGQQRPARLIARPVVHPDAVGFSVRVAAPTSVGAGARVRLGVFDGGAVSWIADQVVRHGERAGRGSWVEVQGDFDQPPASPALLLVLVERYEGCDPPVLFLDSIDVR